MAKTKRTAATAAFNDVIPTAVDPRVFRKVEALCTAALQYGNNHPQIRQAIVALNLDLRMTSDTKYGFDSIDCSTIAQLLKRTDPDRFSTKHQPPPPDRDPIDVLERQKLLTPSQVSAAEIIRLVWQAFGRCLTVSGRGYGGGTIRRSSALQPMDVMGQETWEIYNEVYLPWFNSVKDCTINCRDTGNVKVVKVVNTIVIDEHFPSSVDNFLRLPPGRALGVLQGQLENFFTNPLGISKDRMVDSPPRVAAA